MHLLIAAAGSGRRMGAAGNKLLLEVAGRPVLAWTLDAALACGAIRWIGIVGQPVDAEPIAAIVAAARPDRPVEWILGGDTRQESVSRGLAALPAGAEGVLIHDGARCLVETELLELEVERRTKFDIEALVFVARAYGATNVKEFFKLQKFNHNV